MSRHISHSLLLTLTLLVAAVSSIRGQQSEPELVNIKSIDPTIVVELRYATTRNIAQKPLYPQGMPALVRPEVGRRLAVAQAFLRERGYGLKIWDAYRPKNAHEQLWEFWPISDYVADPAAGGSLHTWGVAVDATLVDKQGREVKMPTDFDEFNSSAMLTYNGNDPTVRRNLRMLQSAMARGGFYGMRTEWWHFVSKDWQNYRPVPDVTLAPVKRAPAPQPTPAPAARASNGGGAARRMTTR